MRTLSHIQCFVAGCSNQAAVQVNGDYMCLPCAKHEIPSDFKTVVVDGALDPMDLIGTPKMLCPDHWCEKHQVNTGEGDICGECEAEFDRYRDQLNAEMKLNAYQLWFAVNGKQFRCPVADFDEAKLLHHCMRWVSGVRIARMDPEQGCESVLHKFS